VVIVQAVVLTLWMPDLLKGNYIPALIGVPVWVLVWCYDSVRLDPGSSGGGSRSGSTGR